MASGPAPAAMVATPALSVPAKADPGQQVKLSGAGFRAGTEVKVVFDSPKREVVGSAVAQPDGTFKVSIVLPSRARPGAHRLQVVGTGQSGRPMALATPVVIVDEQASVATPLAGPSLAEPVLLMLALGLPLLTWSVLEVLGRRGRHGEGEPG